MLNEENLNLFGQAGHSRLFVSAGFRIRFHGFAQCLVSSAQSERGTISIKYIQNTYFIILVMRILLSRKF